MRAVYWALAVALACTVSLGVFAQDIQQSRGIDPRVNYPSLARFGPWDDRNYDLTPEDLAWLAPNEEELTPGIPIFYRVGLRKAHPDMRRTGPAQYPRAAYQMFRKFYGGLLRNGVIQGQADRSAAGRTPVTAEGELKLNDVLSGDEITVEINPVDPMKVIAGSNGGAAGQQMFYSIDGGATWNIGQQGAANGVLDNTCCDPTVAWSSDGTRAYTASLGDVGAFMTTINFYVSTSGGATWNAPALLTPTNTFDDKEFIHVDVSPISAFKDFIYVTWHTGNIMRFARSTNQGANFTIHSFNGAMGAFPNAPLGIGSDITTDSFGNIYYLYAAFSPSMTITSLKSTDGGASFQSPTTVSATNGDFSFKVPAMEARTAWTYAAVDCDRSAGPFAGTIYCAWTDLSGPESPSANLNHAQIVVARSSNQGATWQTSIPHPTADINTVDRFNQWLTVDDSGIVHVVYYNTMNSANRTGVDLYYANSDDGGVTWNPEERISTVTSDNVANAQEWGDYNGVSVVGDRIVMTWTDNRPPGSTSSTDVFMGLMTLQLPRGVIWVDFAAPPGGVGTQGSPYDTLGEAVTAVDEWGTIKIKGDTADSTSSETPTIVKAMRIEAVSGAVQVGVVARSASGASALLMNQLETLRASFGTEAAATSPDLDDGADATTDVFSDPVLPFSMDGDSDSASANAMAVRLRNARSDDAGSVWSQAVTSRFINGLTQTSLTGPTTQDIWITFRPDENEFLDTVISLTGAEGDAPSDADDLANAVGVPLNFAGGGRYNEPLRIWLPLPPGLPSNLLNLYYYQPHGPEKGWHPAEDIEGWLVEGSDVRMTVKGTTYLGYLVRHAAIVQLAAD